MKGKKHFLRNFRGKTGRFKHKFSCHKQLVILKAERHEKNSNAALIFIF